MKMEITLGADIREERQGGETGRRDREERQGGETGRRDREERQGGETGRRDREERRERFNQIKKDCHLEIQL